MPERVRAYLVIIHSRNRNFGAILIRAALRYYDGCSVGADPFPHGLFMSLKCSADGCAEATVASLENHSVCRTHFLSGAYRHLESIAAQIQEPHFHSRHGESAGQFLEQCMREATNIACASEPPGNLERAQLLDILLWASELYIRLRRGPRLRASIPILVRSEDPTNPWEEKTETCQISMHGFSFLCRHELHESSILTCVRLDNGRRVEARVAWAHAHGSGETEAGAEFVADEDFWAMEAGVAAPVFPARNR